MDPTSVADVVVEGGTGSVVLTTAELVVMTVAETANKLESHADVDGDGDGDQHHRSGVNE